MNIMYLSEFLHKFPHEVMQLPESEFTYLLAYLEIKHGK